MDNGQSATATSSIFDIKRVLDFAIRPPTPTPIHVIRDLLRIGDVANIISSTKCGKSWLVLDVATAIATGKNWLGFETLQSPVLLIDNELKPADLERRIRAVCEYKSVELSEIELDFVTLRGRSIDIDKLMELFTKVEPGHYGTIFVDALYKLLPPGTSENDNAALGVIYDKIMTVADWSQSAVMVVHHSSKGSQSNKRTTDVGSGASSINRAVDCLISIREHREEGLGVFEPVVRNLPPIAPITVEFEWPIWKQVYIDPVLKQATSRNEQKTKDNDKQDATRIAKEFSGQQITGNDVKSRFGINKERAIRIMHSDDRFEDMGTRPARRKNDPEQTVFNVLSL